MITLEIHTNMTIILEQFCPEYLYLLSTYITFITLYLDRFCLYDGLTDFFSISFFTEINYRNVVIENILPLEVSEIWNRNLFRPRFPL